MPFILELIIVPCSSMNKFIKENSRLKLKITVSPVAGKANKKIIEILAKTFSCPKSTIRLISGAKSKKKFFLFEQLSQEQGEEIIQIL